ncbi:2,4-dichlorophenol 6-monooxygenase [compost metagenome]
MPHAWLNDTQGRQVSTLDICGKGRLTLFTGHGGAVWCQAAEAARELGIELQVRRIGIGLDYADSYGDWARLREIEEDGCLLVRPDNHIAWRAQSGKHANGTVLVDVLKSLLDRR